MNAVFFLANFYTGPLHRVQRPIFLWLVTKVTYLPHINVWGRTARFFDVA
jgi:hypothetical protein